MKIVVKSFYDYADERKKFYSVHGEGLYYDTYEEALREELIVLGLIIPKTKWELNQSSIPDTFLDGDR